MPKKLVLKEFVRKSAAVYRDKRLRLSRALIVNRARQQFFSTSGFSRDNHRRFRLGKQVDFTQHVHERLTLSHQQIQFSRVFSSSRRLPLTFQQTLQSQQKLVLLVRANHEIVYID
jgi:hypothetical protein